MYVILFVPQQIIVKFSRETNKYQYNQKRVQDTECEPWLNLSIRLWRNESVKFDVYKIVAIDDDEAK